MLVIDILENSSKNFPDKEALVSKDKRFTYSELQRMVNQLSNAFIEEGIRKGDRVAILLRDTYEAVIAYFAILKIGAIEVALNPTTDSPEGITYKFNDCEPKALVTNRLYINLVSEALSKVPSIKIVFFTGDSKKFRPLKQKCIMLKEIFKTQELKDIKIDVKEDDLAIIAYTSGTTGLPNGVMLTHTNLISAAEGKTKDFLRMDKNRCLLLISLYHVFGKMILNICFWNGATVILVENIAFIVEILDMILKEKVTGIIGVPTIYKMVLETLKKSEKIYHFEEIKYLYTGGSKMPPERFIELWKIFPNVAILSGYALTETSSRGAIKIFSKESPEKNKTDACGKAFPPFEMAVVDEAGRNVKTGEIGEVVFRGPSVMKGYWKKPEETKKVLRDGWLYTGDLGKVDEEGELYIIDRKKDIIKSGGELITPKEIEMVIDSHPNVRESAVIGIDDELMGEKIKAFVVLKPGKRAKKEEIMEFCSKRLPPIKIPSSVEFCSSLPKSTPDKVKKSELREKKDE